MSDEPLAHQSSSINWRRISLYILILGTFAILVIGYQDIMSGFMTHKLLKEVEKEQISNRRAHLDRNQSETLAHLYNTDGGQRLIRWWLDDESENESKAKAQAAVLSELSIMFDDNILICTLHKYSQQRRVDQMVGVYEAAAHLNQSLSPEVRHDVAQSLIQTATPVSQKFSNPLLKAFFLDRADDLLTGKPFESDRSEDTDMGLTEREKAAYVEIYEDMLRDLVEDNASVEEIAEINERIASMKE